MKKIVLWKVVMTTRDELLQNRIVLLLGSGISSISGMPTTEELTDNILNGQYNYRDYMPHFIEENNVDPTVAFLKQITSEITEYYKIRGYGPSKKINYEDLFYISKQVYDNEIGDYDNPAIQPFVDKLKTTYPDISNKVQQYFENAMGYIAEVIVNKLSSGPVLNGKVNNLFKEISDDKDINKCDIITLNHDLVIEKYLNNNSINYSDGFSKKDTSGNRYWDLKTYNNNNKISLIKLHGSVNWREAYPLNNSGYDRQLVIKDNYDYINHINDRNYMLRPEPEILIGTFNKMLKYSSGIYLDLLFIFHESLRCVSKIIVSGYSFGDKGINNILIGWMYSSHKNKIYIVHPNEKELINRARGAIKNAWPEWKDNNVLIMISKAIEEVIWDEVKGTELLK